MNLVKTKGMTKNQMVDELYRLQRDLKQTEKIIKYCVFKIEDQNQLKYIAEMFRKLGKK